MCFLFCRLCPAKVIISTNPNFARRVHGKKLMKIKATALVTGAGIALDSDDQVFKAMVRPIGQPGDTHIVSDQMRHARAIRCALQLGYITVEMDGTEASDFVAQVELSGFSGAVGVAGLKIIDLDFHGAADTAKIKVEDDVPYIEFGPNQTERSIWTVTVPPDWQSGTSMFVEVYWSPRTSSVGDVRWRFEHKVVPTGSSVASALSASFLTQAAGSISVLQTTGTSLSIPAASISIGAMLDLAISRIGGDALDTYSGVARVHLVRVRYTGLVFST
jgi:hypothetical protein